MGPKNKQKKQQAAAVVEAPVVVAETNVFAGSVRAHAGAFRSVKDFLKAKHTPPAAVEAVEASAEEAAEESAQ